MGEILSGRMVASNNITNPNASSRQINIGVVAFTDVILAELKPPPILFHFLF